MATGGKPGSALAMSEYFEAGDPRFLDELLATRSDRLLGNLAPGWYRDPRPASRQALVAYVLDGCDRPRHRLLVKRLYKLAEAARDDELMGCFLVAFDRASRRELVERRGYDWKTRETWREWRLVLDKAVAGRDGYRIAATRENPQWARLPDARRRDLQQRAERERYALDRFSRRTRRYLQRRTFRYLRGLALADPARYGRAVRAALVRYRDEHLDKPEKILDAWGLVHALWWGEAVLDRRPGGVVLAAGRTLAEVKPAPCCPAAWEAPAVSLDELFDLAVRAGSRTVRTWTIAFLEARRGAELATLPIDRLRPLLASPHPELQTFGARLLRSAAGLESLPVSAWLELLSLDNAEALPLLCELVARHVAPARLTLAQKVSLCCARPAPVAELGLSWLRAQTAFAAADLEALLPLSGAAAPRTRAAAARWLCDLLAASPQATPHHLRELVDARFADVRGPALELLAGPRFSGETALWAAAAESPYDDVRAALVKHLEASLDGLSADALRHLWATSILAVHRGGKAKRLVAAQVARRIVARPDEAAALLPLLRHLLRSVRAPERRAALGPLVQAALAAPALRAAVAAGIPELDLGEAA
jgi:hypothetical protein